MCDPEAGSSTPKRVRKEPGNEKKSWRKQPFVDSWLEEPQFKGWLSKASDNYKAKCLCCKKELVAGKSELERHGDTPTHKTNALQIKNVPKISDLFRRTSGTEETKTKFAELKIVYDVIEHDRSFNSMEHIVQLNQVALPDSTIARSIKLHRTKITSLVNNVVGRAVQQKNAEVLKGNFFSILVDESTDIGNNKNLCILAKSIGANGITMNTFLLDYVKIKDASAENLFQVFKHCMSKYGLLFENIVGYCSDNANVMAGENNSFVTRLLKENDGIIVFGCICHSLNLVASAASECLPKNVESLLHLIFSYFSRSPKRQGILEELQDFMRACQVRMINPSKTRWLALGNCIARVLSQWPVLFSLFAEAKSEDKNTVADIIFADLNNPYTKAYLQFLNFVLPTFNSFNKLFQSDKVLIHCFANEAERFLRLLASNFLKPELILGDSLFTCNAKHPSNILPLIDIKIGAAAEETISDLKTRFDHDVSKDVEYFRLRCLQFHQVAFQETQKRVPLQQGCIRALNFLQPSNALGVDKSIQRANIELSPLIKKFESKIDPIATKDEWDHMSNYFSSEEKTAFLNLPILEFWREIEVCENFNAELQFKNIGKLARICLSLPHSNASVERIFSMVSDIKTKKRNKLFASTVASLVRVKLDMQNMKKACYEYPVTEKMLELFNENMYKKDHKETEIAGLLAAEDEEDETVI
ncbi:uncharacterized protein LOC134534752 isoform X2 [Bacillus rossius redtenbacheri]|uniref:uncharacterized protein LOC134534752 isoform X2 n=1 Tax=Bacillus rossius redtenbacheri TaxID=93214 RepID=UPI002FDD80BB